MPGLFGGKMPGEIFNYKFLIFKQFLMLFLKHLDFIYRKALLI